jgi:hypothetical protein
MTWIYSVLAGGLAWSAAWLLSRVAGHVVWYQRCSQRHFALLAATRAARRGRVGGCEQEFIRTHGLDLQALTLAAPLLVAVSGAELAYVCRMLGRRAALEWTAAVVSEPGGRAALEMVHALPAFGRRARRLRRATGRLTGAGGPGGWMRNGTADCAGLLRAEFVPVGGGAVATMDSRRG